jgi:hypothetical protein
LATQLQRIQAGGLGSSGYSPNRELRDKAPILNYMHGRIQMAREDLQCAKCAKSMTKPVTCLPRPTQQANWPRFHYGNTGIPAASRGQVKPTSSVIITLLTPRQNVQRHLGTITVIPSPPPRSLFPFQHHLCMDQYNVHANNVGMIAF